MKNFRLLVPSLSVLLPALALAQPQEPKKSVDLDAPTEVPDAEQGQPEQPEQEQPSETAPITPEQAAPAFDPAKPPPPGAEPHPTVPPGQDYTVKSGDTLWDISGSYLQSPWFWPKLWSYNPQIANPHWIYPGNSIHFYPGGGTQVPAETPAAPVAAEQLQPQEEEVDVRATGRIGYVPPGTTLAPTQGFITARELAQAGEIAGSPEEKELLSLGDAVYLRFAAMHPNPGDELVIFRKVKEVRHPVTGETYGYLTQLRGTVKITATGKALFSALIDRNFDSIERGDLVGSWGEKYLRNVALRQNDRSMAGYVVATMVPELFNIGEGHLVFVDRGRRDGVQEGNTFDVVIRREGLTEDYSERWMPGYPVETIGRLLIVDTKDNASEALVMNSVREIAVGDHVQMVAK